MQKRGIAKMDTCQQLRERKSREELRPAKRLCATPFRSNCLCQAGWLHLLEKFYTYILILPAVARELEPGRAVGVNLTEIWD